MRPRNLAVIGMYVIRYSSNNTNELFLGSTCIQSKLKHTKDRALMCNVKERYTEKKTCPVDFLHGPPSFPVPAPASSNGAYSVIRVL